MMPFSKEMKLIWVRAVWGCGVSVNKLLPKCGEGLSCPGNLETFPATEKHIEQIIAELVIDFVEVENACW